MNSRRPLMCRRFMPSGDAPNGEKAQTLQRDLGCPASAQKIFRFAFEANQLPLRCVLFRKRGTLAIVTNVGTGRGGRKATSSRVFARGTNGEASVRRSRVVLTPRRWRQVGDDVWSFSWHHSGDGRLVRTARSHILTGFPDTRARRKP
jgi:hypothetical protein